MCDILYNKLYKETWSIMQIHCAVEKADKRTIVVVVIV